MFNDTEKDTIPHAVINYVSMSGDNITEDWLAATLEDWAIVLEGEAESAEGDHKEALLKLVEEIRRYAPDFDAAPPKPDPVLNAQWLLAKERASAQKLLNEEAERARKESAIKEAFCIPEGLICRVLQAIIPADMRRDGFDDAYGKAARVFEDAGWQVYTYCYSLPSDKKQEPLRQLSKMLENFPIHPLTAQVCEALSYALRWCENTSCRIPSPITGEASGIAPEGVFFPRLTLELEKVESNRDIPAEWAGKLVKEDAQS
jgi:hypothetical protein